MSEQLAPEKLRKVAQVIGWCNEYTRVEIAHDILAAADAWDLDLSERISNRKEMLKYMDECIALRQRLEEAEKAWAEFKEHYPWEIQPYDDMQMIPEAVGALEHLAAALAQEKPEADGESTNKIGPITKSVV